MFALSKRRVIAGAWTIAGTAACAKVCKQPPQVSGLALCATCSCTDGAGAGAAWFGTIEAWHVAQTRSCGFNRRPDAGKLQGQWHKGCGTCFLWVRREINLKRQKQILMMAMMAIIGCDPGSWRRPSLTRYARYVLFDPKIKILRCGDLKHWLFCKNAKTLRLYLAIHSDCLSMKLFACGVMVAPRMSVPDADCTLRWGLLWLRLFLLEESVSSGPVMFGKAMAVCGRRCWVIRAFGPCWVRLTLSHAAELSPQPISMLNSRWLVTLPLLISLWQQVVTLLGSIGALLLLEWMWVEWLATLTWRWRVSTILQKDHGKVKSGTVRILPVQFESVCSPLKNMS